MEQRPTLIMMKGLPFSGKTEWATKWAAEDPTRRIRLSWSDFLRSTGRATVTGTSWLLKAFAT